MKDFTAQANQIEQQLFPHKQIRLGDLRQVDGPLFDLNGIDLMFEPSAEDSLNRQIGTTHTQLDMVRRASGDVGEVNLRNCLSDAASFTDNKEVVIVASPQMRHIVNVLIPRHEFIPARQYFDFAQLFMDEAGYDFEKMQTQAKGRFDIMIYMQSRNPTIRQFAPGEDTITDGAYLHWTGDQIELGNFYTHGMYQRRHSHRDKKKDKVADIQPRRSTPHDISWQKPRIAENRFQDLRAESYRSYGYQLLACRTTESVARTYGT